jgi:hypothetical protein
LGEERKKKERKREKWLGDFYPGLAVPGGIFMAVRYN